MKKAILVFASGVMMVACSNTPKFKSEAISAVRNELLDPNSFELIKYEFDTITFHNDLRGNIIIDSLDIDLYTSTVSIWEDSKNSYGKKYYQKELINLNQAKKSLDSNLALLNSSSDSIIGYFSEVRYYANSKGGQRVIGEMRVKFDHKGFITGTTDLDN